MTPSNNTTAPADGSRTAAAAGNPLAGTKWRVARVGHSVIARSFHAKVEFTAARASGDDGCNDFGADYQVRGAKLRFSNFVSTAVGCDEPPSVIGPMYRTRRYRITGRTLELLGRRGRTLAVLRR